MSIFNEVELPKNADIIAEADTEIHIAARTRKASRRKPLPEVLPHEKRVYDLSYHEKICACGQSLKHI